MKKGRATLGNMVIAFLVVSGVMLGISSFNSSISSTYNKTATDVGFSQIDLINDTLISDLYSKVDTGISFFTYVGWLWSAGLLAVRSFVSLASIFNSYVAFVAEKVMIPAWFLNMLLVVGAFVVVYKVALGLLGRDER